MKKFENWLSIVQLEERFELTVSGKRGGHLEGDLPNLHIEWN